jgi:hypothetical protein
MMQFGVCYYPEHWPEARWAEDARQMRALGLSIVRIAEFAWSRIEPQEGRFAWEWLDRAVATLSAAGLKIVLGTPTAAPPAWLSRGYPDTLPVDEQGRRRNFGSRRHYCPNHPAYRRFSRRIVSLMAAHFAAHPAVVGWQIDNEFGGGGTARCYCEHCADAFRRWLQARYGTLEALNQAWGTVFWSQEYSAWEQIGPPILTGSAANPSHTLDYYRFASDSWVDYQQMQLEALGPHRRADQFATHNGMGLFFTALDYMLHRFDAVGRRMALRAQSLAELQAWQHELRAQLRRTLGLDTMRRAPLEPKITERIALDGYVRERVELQTEPGIIMPLYVLTPDDLRPGERRPAMLAPHGHGSAGKYAPAGRRDIPAVAATIAQHNYDYGVQLVRRGFVVFCPDARGFGERRELANQAAAQLLGGSCALLNHMAIPLGQTVAGMWTWDLMRLIDYVATRPECDPGRIGCAGLSGGGLQTLWLAARDARGGGAVGFWGGRSGAGGPARGAGPGFVLRTI